MTSHTNAYKEYPNFFVFQISETNGKNTTSLNPGDFSGYGENPQLEGGPESGRTLCKKAANGKHVGEQNVQIQYTEF